LAEEDILSPPLVRVSIGSAILLGLVRGRVDAKPTTLYLLTYHEGKCRGNCAFCSQAKESSSKEELLSRVTWPVFSTQNVVQAIRVAQAKELCRICIQAINYQNVFAEVLALTRYLRKATDLPISLSSRPLSMEEMEELHAAGIDRIGIPLDTATKSLFEKVKGRTVGGPYLWKEHMRGLNDAVSIFGKGRVSTHLIVGLGERDKEFLRMVQRMIDMGVYPSLFAFTPIPGSRYENLPRPRIERYRRIQIAQHLITCHMTNVTKMKFDSSGNLVSFGVDKDFLLKIVGTGRPFMTSGCPGCNRPYYNERPGGQIYNYPVQPQDQEVEEIADNLLRGKKDV